MLVRRFSAYPAVTSITLNFSCGFHSLVKSLFTRLLGLVAYMLALFAYTFAPLSYSGAIREVSAVIGAFLGWRFLKEEMGGIRVVGSAIVFAGVMVIAVFG